MKKIFTLDIQKFVNLVKDYYIIQRSARGFSGTIKFEGDTKAIVFTVVDGVLEKGEVTDAGIDATLYVKATDEQWDNILSIDPPPFYQHFEFAAFIHGIKYPYTVECFPYTPLIQELIYKLTNYQAGLPLIEAEPEVNTPNTRFDDIIGKYVYLTIDGIEYRVYYEESGQGIPMLLQHTAGSDGRQYHRVLNDKDFTKDFRFIAYDLPYHGKSLPPLEYPWWNHEYNLTFDFLLKFFKEFNAALNLDHPAYMGCSMGGHLAPDLALYAPESFRATIGIGAGLTNAAHTKDAGGVTMKAIRNEHQNPKVAREHLGYQMMGNCPPYPHSTPNTRREIFWEYNQGGDGVFCGDINYYSIDHHLTPEQAKKIDTSKCMLYLLTGDYDVGTDPACTKLLADLVEGCKFYTMPGCGHFSMTEAYHEFKPFLTTVFEDIKKLK